MKIKIKPMIDGVRFSKQNGYAVCHIDFLSDEIKAIIREQLSSVCYGPAKAATTRRSYNYQNTLKEFLKRYETKADDTKMGMIGELLTHIIIRKYFPEFDPVSPYFNLEERSIKKGFDVLLYAVRKNMLWIAEVKSGELHKNKTANETITSLFGTAKRDLEKRLNENEVTFWENAINGASVALENNRDMKNAVIDLLGSIEDEISDENAISTDKNVILVASLFSALTDEINEKDVQKNHAKLKGKNTFNDVILLSFQKETYKRVADFLKMEAGKHE